VRARDPGCLISGLRVANNNYARLKAAHIFPRAHDVEVCLVISPVSHKADTDNGFKWVNKGYPSFITDPAPPQEVGGPTKIDSIQNVILLRSDLHDAWDNYQIAVNPDVCINFFCPCVNSYVEFV
jgi:hypothetical protein